MAQDRSERRRVPAQRLVAGLWGTLLALACGGGDAPPHMNAEAALEAFADPELEPFFGDLEAMRERGVIRALVTPSRTDFFLDGGQIRGIQAEYLHALEKRLNRGVRREAEKLRIVFVPVPFRDLIPALIEGRGDLAAAFLTATAERSEQVAFPAPLLGSVSEVLVTRRGASAPGTLRDLSGRRLYVLAGSSYAEHLRALDARLRQEGLEGLEVEEADPRLRSEDILEFVNAGIVEATVVDDYKAELWQSVLPRIEVHGALALRTENRLGWAVRAGAPQLREALDRFAREAREGALLGNVLLQRYFENTQWISDPTAREERDKLNRYLDLFREYGERFGFDPLALAAQAYQESRLDPDRRSPKGAVGLMQLLPSTAADPQVGIPDIEDPESNIHAGAKYLAFLRARYFDEEGVSAWDQRALSWAAYNAGPRKIQQARRLAEKLGLERNTWFDNVEVAAARSIGREPVRYVANVYRYYVAYRLSSVHEEERRRAAEQIR